jgi:hypothetical protein
MKLAINGHAVGILAVLSLPIGQAILWVSALDFLFHLKEAMISSANYPNGFRPMGHAS